MQNKQEKSYYDMRCEFYEKFKNEMKPKLSRIEKDRKERLREIKLLYVVSILFCIFSAIMLVVWIAQFFRFDIDPDGAMVSLILFGVLFLISIVPVSLAGNGIKKKIAQIKTQIKHIIMPLSVSCYNHLNWYFGTYQKEDKQELLDSCVIPTNYPLGFENIFEGNYKNVLFEMMECYQAQADNARKIGQLVDTDEKRYYGNNYFAGVIIKIKMNKKNIGHTVIIPDSKLRISPACGLKHTVLEDINFEKKFDVFTDNEIEARYLITPSFMERLMHLKTIFSAKRMSCAFYGTNLYVALYSNRKLFSMASIKEPVDDLRQYESLHNEIISIYKLIDHFKLNENTGL